MQAILHSGEEVILREIEDPRATRKSIAQTYAFLLRQEKEYPYDWFRINSAIAGRWGLRGLDYVKRKAWELVKKAE